MSARSGSPGRNAIVPAAYRILVLLTRMWSRLCRGRRSRKGVPLRSTTGCVAMRGNDGTSPPSAHSWGSLLSEARRGLDQFAARDHATIRTHLDGVQDLCAG